MAFSVTRIIEIIVDFTHDEIVALEAHLGIHPNRKPAPAAPAVSAEALTEANTKIESLKAQLGEACAHIAALETAADAAKTPVQEPQPSNVAPTNAEAANVAAAASQDAGYWGPKDLNSGLSTAEEQANGQA